MSNVVTEQKITAKVGQDASQMRRLVIASVLGNALEWYDFFLYGTAAALVFGPLFFPVGGDPLQGTLLAFSGFAVGFWPVRWAASFSATSGTDTAAR